MRTLEILLVLGCLWLLMRLTNQPLHDRLSGTLAAMVLVLVVAQLLVEGWRPPFVPVYPIAVALVAWAWLSPVTNGQNGLIAAATGLVFLGVAIVGCWVFPFQGLARTEGPYPIGTATIALDVGTRSSPESLHETFRPEPLVRLWYPAGLSPQSGEAGLRLAARLQAHLRAQPPPPAIEDAPLGAQEACPVLVYFPGWPGTRLQNLTLVRELASRGYLVAAVQYPARPPGTSEETYQSEVRRLDRPMQDYSSDANFRESVAANDERLQHNAEDASRILTQLARLNAHDPQQRLTGRLDVDRAGVVGYSFGGAVAAETRRLDPRFKAAVNIDGRHYGSALEHGVPAPYLFVGEILVMPTQGDLNSRVPATHYEALLDHSDYTNLASNLRRNGGIQVTLPNTTHPNFSDDALKSPIRRFSGIGKINARWVLMTLNQYVVDFFDQSLRHKTTRLLQDGPAPLPGVRVDIYRK
ncbi:MAG TPA: dienelactone hydrolase family protein [Steroidobacteraceae bacterium]|jgi:dienelactone hydrolase|nr:dienelactone hydrolase family protein [Steroidobacteraceae bacterium]